MIKNILFDFGGVMVGKKGGGPVRLFEEKYHFNKGEIKDKIDLLILDFEKGLISFDGFLKGLKKKLGDDLAIDLCNFWQDKNDVIYFEDMFVFVKKLQNKGYKCYLMSDTNPTHKKTNKLSGFYNVFDKLILSCDIGFSKKEDNLNGTTKFFDYAMEKLNILSEESIFIDDVEDNCITANRAGIKTILAKNPKQVISDLSGILYID